MSTISSEITQPSIRVICHSKHTIFIEITLIHLLNIIPQVKKKTTTDLETQKEKKCLIFGGMSVCHILLESNFQTKDFIYLRNTNKYMFQVLVDIYAELSCFKNHCLVRQRETLNSFSVSRSGRGGGRSILPYSVYSTVPFSPKYHTYLSNGLLYCLRHAHSFLYCLNY